MNLGSKLNHLETSDLVRRLREEEPAYVFKHALVQDTAFESLLRNERKRLHLLVAETLEHLYAERLDEFAARLFQHYDAAGDEHKALFYAQRAGDAAMRVSAHTEAVTAYRRALDLAQSQAESSGTIVRLMTQLGRAYELAPDYDAAFGLYQKTRDDARTRNDRALELAALVQMSKVLAVAAMRYDPVRSMEIAQQALELARALDDQHAEARLLWIMMLMNLYGGVGAQQSVNYGQRSLELARKLDWREQMAYTLNDLVYTYLNLGDMPRAEACGAEAGMLWRELDNKPMLTDNLNASGMTYALRGQYQNARDAAREARAISQTIGNAWGETTSYMVDGYVFMERGDFVQAFQAFEMCMRTGDPIHVLGPIMMARFELAVMYAYTGDVERAAELAREGLELSQLQAFNWQGWAYSILALAAEERGDTVAFMQAVNAIGDAPNEYFMARVLPPGVAKIMLVRARAAQSHGQWSGAQEILEQALARMNKGEYHVLVPPLLCQLARLHLAQGKPFLAQEILARALEQADRLQMRAVQFEILGTQLEWARQVQDGAAAAAIRSRGQTLLAEMLPLMPNNVRASFLQTARVRVFEND